MTGTIVASWFCRIVAAAILMQSLFFKFTAAEESVYIFEQLGVEPWGRYLVGCIELLASVMLLIPATAWIGAITALVVMAGAIMAHALQLGFAIEYDAEQGSDGGILFALAILVAICASTTLVLHRRDLPFGPWKGMRSDPTADPDLLPGTRS